MTLVLMVWIMQVMKYMLMMFLMNNLVMMRSKRMMLMTMLQIDGSPDEGVVRWTMLLMFVLLLNNIVMMR